MLQMARNQLFVSRCGTPICRLSLQESRPYHSPPESDQMPTPIHSKAKRITTHILQEMKEGGEKIAMLTGYDFSMAKILDDAGIDIILVGDSASNVMAGHETTLPITLDQMIYHASSVVRAVSRSLVVVDLPFGSYQGNSKLALESAVRHNGGGPGPGPVVGRRANRATIARTGR